MEERLLDLVRRGGLPEPGSNVIVEGREVDFLWMPQRLIVETDGFEFHGSRRAFERDRDRDAALLAAGYRIMRVTWNQLRDQPEAVLVRITRALAVGG